MQVLLHTGVEHPNTLWIAVAAVLSFVLGVGAGAYGRRLAAAVRAPFEDGS
jgi:hypothetical protein